MADRLIPERLRELWLKAGETHADLAAAIDVSRSYVTHILNGEKQPGRKVLTKIADHYDVSVDYLVGRSAIRKPSAGNETLKEANERALLAAFHALPADDQQLAVRIIRGMKAGPTPEPSTPKRKRHDAA